MILQIDSNYRNYLIYPNASQFELNINGAAQEERQDNDVRGTFTTPYFAHYAYSWIGNTNSPIMLGNAEVENDSLLVNIVPISTNSFLLLEIEGVHLPIVFGNDYFMGLLLYYQGFSSKIISYDKNNRNGLVESDLFIEYSYSCCLKDANIHELKKQAYIINPSYYWEKNLVILGSSSSLLVGGQLQYLLSKGISTDLFIENVSKKWKRKVVSVLDTYKNIVVSSIPSYSSNDFFVVWKNEYSYLYESKHLLFYHCISSFMIQDSSVGIKKGDTLKNSAHDIECIVLEVDTKTRKVTKIKLILPGKNLEWNQSVKVVLERDNEILFCQLLVQGITNCLVLDNDVEISNKIPFFPPNLFFIGIADVIGQRLFYLYYQKQEQNEIFFSINEVDAAYLNTIVYPIWNRFSIFFISYQNIIPTINVPLQAYDNRVCYEMELLNICLPNLPVCGFNILLSDFPFLIVALSNGNGQSSNIQNVITTNNPNVFHSNFIVTIANIVSPNIVKFVCIKNKQRTSIKFTFRDSIYFSVLLPNGSLLQFSRGVLPSTSADVFSSPFPITCSSLDYALNKKYSPNDRQIFANEIQNSITATFQLTEISG